MNFEGKGFQLHYGAPAELVTLEEKPLLFACGCAMLVDRAVFIDAGGWDEGTFAYYEDVELGWRLNLLGHEVWFAPRAVVYHKHHGTSGRWPEPPRQRLYERNSLRMLYCLLETESLERALPAALLLAADRALLATGLSRAADATPQSAVPPVRSAAGRAALRARGITRSMPIAQIFSRLRARRILGLARDVRRLRAAQESRSRRDAYLIESGAACRRRSTPTSSPCPSTPPRCLSGIYGFLTEIPELVERRARGAAAAPGRGPMRSSAGSARTGWRPAARDFRPSTRRCTMPSPKSSSSRPSASRGPRYHVISGWPPPNRGVRHGRLKQYLIGRSRGADAG